MTRGRRGSQESDVSLKPGKESVSREREWPTGENMPREWFGLFDIRSLEINE